jgi:Ca2+-binding RTX toxin-like protein
MAFIQGTEFNDNDTTQFNGTSSQFFSRLIGTTTRDFIDGLGGDDILIGGDGDDILIGNTGADIMNGGNDSDVYFVDNLNDIVIESTDDGVGGTIDQVSSLISYTLGFGLEILVLYGDASIDGTGNRKDNTIGGNDAPNRLDGGVGADKMFGYNGDDIYIVDNSGDFISDINSDNGSFDAGNDTVLSSVAYTLGIDLENLTLTGTDAINGTGNEENNLLNGNSAANTLDGGLGADTMNGGDGNDTYYVDNPADTAIETFEDPAAGIDTVNASVTYNLSFGINNLNLTGAVAISGTGNELNNIINGNTAANSLNGADGNDTLFGYGGNDQLNGGNGNDTLNGGGGADAMAGGSGNDNYTVDNIGDTVTEAFSAGTDAVNASVSYTLNGNIENLTLTATAAINGTGNNLNNLIQGNAAANRLNGGTGNDNLLGNGGNDILAGGLGNDSLSGGLGSDICLFNTALGAGNVDTLIGYNASTDTIQLENAIFTKFTATGAILPGNFKAGAGAVATDANDFLLYNTTTGALSYDADGNGAIAAIRFASLTGAPALTTAEFTII